MRQTRAGSRNVDSLVLLCMPLAIFLSGSGDPETRLAPSLAGLFAWDIGVRVSFRFVFTTKSTYVQNTNDTQYDGIAHARLLKCTTHHVYVTAHGNRGKWPASR